MSNGTPFPIDRGVPLRKPLNESIYPFAKMRPGDSFFIDNCSMITAHRSFCRRHPAWDFVSRREGSGVRVYCVKAPTWETP